MCWTHEHRVVKKKKGVFVRKRLTVADLIELPWFVGSHFSPLGLVPRTEGKYMAIPPSSAVYGQNDTRYKACDVREFAVVELEPARTYVRRVVVCTAIVFGDAATGWRTHVMRRA